jgi:hypothetical protein
MKLINYHNFIDFMNLILKKYRFRKKIEVNDRARIKQEEFKSMLLERPGGWVAVETAN